MNNPTLTQIFFFFMAITSVHNHHSNSPPNVEMDRVDVDEKT